MANLITVMEETLSVEVSLDIAPASVSSKRRVAV